MESVLDDCLAQFSSKCVLKEEQCQAVLGLLERKDVVAPVRPRVLGKANLRHLSAFVRGFAAEKLKQREKNVVLVASLLRSISNDQVEAE